MAFLAKICSTVPESKREEAREYLQSIKRVEEERLKHVASAGAERDSISIALATFMMNKWSPRMRRRVEHLILKKAIQENYLKNTEVKYVFVFDLKDDEIKQTDWFVDDQDEFVVSLVWEKFNMKEHFKQVHEHRTWVKRSYDRLKHEMPSLSVDIIERHDLSKFSFSQAVGYTLRFVHNIHHDICRKAFDLHLHNEPHHPQMWSQHHTLKQKQDKLKTWIMEACDFSRDTEGPYGLNLVGIDFSSEDLAEAFLLESFVDMVAVEWERIKGQRLDISTAELVYIEDKFLSRYSLAQRRFIKDLMTRIMGTDVKQGDAQMSEREKILLSIVPDRDRARVINQLVQQKRNKISQLKNEQVAAGKSTDDLQRLACDEIFFTTLAVVVTELWDKGLKDTVEELVLQRAIAEGYIKDCHRQWIFVLDGKDKYAGVEDTSGLQSESISVPNSDLVKIIWEDFNMREHFKQVRDHRQWVMHGYHRLSKYTSDLPEEVIERHDLSKFAFSQAIGYTLKWVHKISHHIWRKACDLHLHREPHHPQMWSRAHDASYKHKCLESWLCEEAGGVKYGLQVSTLNLASDNMAKVFLLESLIDMVGIEWERRMGGKSDATNSELVHMDHKYLERYSSSDRMTIIQLMELIRKDKPESEKE